MSSQNIKPCVSHWHPPVTVSFQASLQLLHRTRSSFLPMRAPTATETHSCLSQAAHQSLTMVKLAHQGICIQGHISAMCYTTGHYGCPFPHVSKTLMSSTSSKKVPLISTGRTELPQNHILLSLITGQLHWLVCTRAVPRRGEFHLCPYCCHRWHTQRRAQCTVLSVSRKPLGSE